MRVSNLRPPPENMKRFAYPDLRELPTESGCYVLSTANDSIVYIGQATDIERRVTQHFNDPEKRDAAPHGVAFWCHYLRAESVDLNRLERGWLGQYQITTGALPYFNKQSGPV